MNAFQPCAGYSIVSLVIPQGRLHDCLEAVLDEWPYQAMHFDCRGTLLRENWLQNFLPSMNPECEFLQFMVKDCDIEPFMQYCQELNDLRLPGAGAIFSTPCTDVISNAPMVTDIPAAFDIPTLDDEASAVEFKQNHYAVFALLQSGRTEQAIKAAMQAGSHGPIVYFVEGRGTRDRAGWLKITKNPYEEVVMVLVEDLDRASVIEALVNAGRVGTLGGGVVFDMPLSNAMVSLPTSVGNRSQRSTNEQITSAIDELMGNTDWRNQRSLEALMEKVQSSQAQQHLNTSSVLLCALLPRKYANAFLDHVLIVGIPGANVTYPKLFSSNDADDNKKVSIHHELVQVRMVVPEDKAAEFSDALQQFTEDKNYEGVTLYRQALADVVRYQAKPKTSSERKKKRMYRGSRIED